MKLQINIDKALDALRIQGPVKVVNRAMPAGMVGGVRPDEPGVIKLDLRQVEDLDEAREIIAHELVHVAQMEKFDHPMEAHYAYQRESRRHGYRGNRFEREAYAVGPKVEPYVQFERAA